MNRYRTCHPIAAFAMALAVTLVNLPTQADSTTLSPEMPVTLHGIGPIRLGMTLAEAEKAIGDKLPSEYTEESKECGYASPQHGPDGLSFMLHEDRIVRIDVDSRRFRTERGARIADTEKRIKELYQGATVYEHKYDENGHYIEVEPQIAADKGLLLLFETDGKKVTTFRVGRAQETRLVEHCF